MTTGSTGCSHGLRVSPLPNYRRISIRVSLLRDHVHAIRWDGLHERTADGLKAVKGGGSASFPPHGHDGRWPGFVD